MEEVLGSLSLVVLVALVAFYFWLMPKLRWTAPPEGVEPQFPTDAERAHVAWIIGRFTRNSTDVMVHEHWEWEHMCKRWNVTLEFTYQLGSGALAGVRKWHMWADPEFKEGGTACQ